MVRVLLAAFALVACGPKSSFRPIPLDRLDVAGTVRVDDYHVHYELLFERNAIEQVLEVGSAVVARTSGGQLLKFDPGSQPRSLIVSAPLTSLAADHAGGVLAGFANGDLARVNVADLSVDVRARIDGVPYWIAERASDSSLVVAASRNDEAFVYRVAKAGHVDAVRLPRTWPGLPQVFALDSAGDVWFGVDAGEWGGAAGEVEWSTHSARVIDAIKLPVRGLVERGDSMWIYGGQDHLQTSSAFVSEVRDHQHRWLWRQSGRSDQECIQPECTAVREKSVLEIGAPIRHITVGDKLRVLIADELWEVEPEFKNWRRILRLPAQHDGTPRQVFDVSDGANGDLLLATQEGWLRIHDDVLTEGFANETERPSLSSASQPQTRIGDRNVVAEAPWTDGRRLLATDRGLTVFDPASKQWGAAPFASPDKQITHLVTDRDGWLWLASDTRIWFRDNRGALHEVTKVPGFGMRNIHQVMRDDREPHAIFVALTPRDENVVRLSVAN